VFVPKNMSAGRLYRGTHQVHRDFYSYRSIIKRASLRKHWSVWFAFNLLYRQTVVASRSHAVGATEPAPKAT
ncbi:MAG: hypothetical protein KKH73_01440, partial [Actinobacteria bacterium]|nr:hypothetical protein [Actinomycetota bacterium]